MGTLQEATNMRHPGLLDRRQAVLLIIDVQESFRNHIPDFSILTRNISTLVEASKILKVPVMVTEQYPQGLGRTAAEITACLGEHILLEKKCFSCCELDAFMNALAQQYRKQVIVSGIEAHVCVNQTVHDLLEAGYTPHVVADSISSRSTKNKDIGWEKMILSGAVPSSVETALF